MSRAGIDKAAEAFRFLQTARGELLKMGCCPPIDKEDIALGQMLEDGKRAMVSTFTRLTSGHKKRHKGKALPIKEALAQAEANVR